VSNTVPDPGRPSQDPVGLLERNNDDGGVATKDAEAMAVGLRVLGDTVDDASVCQNRNPQREMTEAANHWTRCGEWLDPVATAGSKRGRA
jgi:hypothetical protein